MAKLTEHFGIQEVVRCMSQTSSETTEKLTRIANNLRNWSIVGNIPVHQQNTTDTSRKLITAFSKLEKKIT
jgi:hypothetical protein